MISQGVLAALNSEKSQNLAAALAETLPEDGFTNVEVMAAIAIFTGRMLFQFGEQVSAGPVRQQLAEHLFTSIQIVAGGEIRAAQKRRSTN